MFDLVALFLSAGCFYPTASVPVPFCASYVPPIGKIKVQFLLL